jgi:nitrogen fixation protein NifU and related proteins
MDDLYQETILAEARAPKNQGTMDAPDLEGTGVNASCGDTVKVMIQLDATKNKILDIRWQGAGCIISQASMSILSELVKKMSLQQVQALTQETILEHLGLEEITPARSKCLLLGLRAIKKTID